MTDADHGRPAMNARRFVGWQASKLLIGGACGLLHAKQATAKRPTCRWGPNPGL